MSAGDELPRRARRALVAWYEEHRRELPWRDTRDPYAIWVSETMLQQTRVDTVTPYFARFMGRFPTLQALAEAERDDVLAAWAGLGYYRRARMLHDGAREVHATRRRLLPATREDLLAVPGVGPYTAGAILSIAFGQREALVDGNVARVVSRWFALEEDPARGSGKKRLWDLARSHVAKAADPGAWNQALMELGATVCLPRSPRCGACPVREDCAARALGRQEELPRLARKRTPPTEHLRVLLCRRRSTILLGRRVENVRFGGMWEPPAIEVRGRPTSAAVARSMEDLLGASIGAMEPLGVVTHTLTHRRLHARVYGASVASRTSPRPAFPYSEWAWVDVGKMAEVGLSTFSRKLIDVGCA